MLHDIHSHTYYSFCGRDDPHLTVNAAIDAGLELFGICDHNYGITRDGRKESIGEYFDFLTTIKNEYRGKIKIARGIELCTLSGKEISDDADVSFFDYALMENIDHPDSVIAPKDGKTSGIFDYAKRLGCKVGIAHTDLFAFAKSIGAEPLEFFSRLAGCGIFWEMNVSCDSIHNYREHQYVKSFRSSSEQQDIIRKSGIEISVGFDGHRIEDYRPDLVTDICSFLDTAEIKTFTL